VFLQPYELRHAVRHQHERRYQHPEPPALPDASRQHNRDDDKRNAQEDVFERLFEREFAAASRPAEPVNFIYGWLLELTRQRLWHEADICSATATKTRAVEILGSAPGTEHLFSAFHV
jgi:hypothetical protein